MSSLTTAAALAAAVGGVISFLTLHLVVENLGLVALAVGEEVVVDDRQDVPADSLQLLLDLGLVVSDQLQLVRLRGQPEPDMRGQGGGVTHAAARKGRQGAERGRTTVAAR